MTRKGPDPEDMIETLVRLAMACKDREWERQRRRWQREKIQRRRDKKRRRRAATDRALAAWRSRPNRPRRPAFGFRAIDRMVAAMAPGEWYGRNDIARLAGLAKYFNGKVLQELLPRGLVERRRNPAYDGRLVARGAVVEPPWVYRLTARGELVRELVRLIG